MISMETIMDLIMKKANLAKQQQQRSGKEAGAPKENCGDIRALAEEELWLESI